MKKSWMVLCTFFLCMLVSTFGMQADAAPSLAGKVILIDPGHGGHNPGAVANGSTEAENNLAVSMRLQEKLERGGAKVVMTRMSDRSVAKKTSSLTEELAARVAIAEAQDADIYVSIHSKSNHDPRIYGAMTFYSSKQSRQLAETIQKNLVYRTKAKDMGSKAQGFYVLRNTSMPSVLVEMGFVSNPQEAKLLNGTSYREKIADGLYEGIEEYFRR